MTTAPDTGARLVGAALVEHPYPFYDRLRQQAPVWRVPATDAFLVSGCDLVTEAAGRYSAALSGTAAAPTTRSPRTRGHLRRADDDRRERRRRAAPRTGHVHAVRHSVASG